MLLCKLLHVKLPKANQALHQTGIGVGGVNSGKPGDRLVSLNVEPVEKV